MSRREATSAASAIDRCSGLYGGASRSMVMPKTSYPCCLSIAAAAELSTPPDMATQTLVSRGVLRRPRLFGVGVVSIFQFIQFAAQKR